VNALDQAINGLRRRSPEMSAYRTFSRGQRRVLLAVAAATLLGLVIRPLPTLIVLNLLVTILYVAAFAYKFHLARRSLRRPTLVEVTDEDARAVPDADLPLYTVLVPAYHEAEVIGQTIVALEKLEYPRDRLEVKILLEEDDFDTILAAAAARPGPHVEIIQVPKGDPRTKPKACNYGLLLSRGELVTIFDAEDRPDPLQLRRAVVAFGRLDPSIACLQAKLSYHNTDQNLITGWFTVEYATWFSMMLPVLAAEGGPVPLGGTSMHIMRPVLEAIGAWDPHNVTEDADLGIRLQRMGYRTAVLDSTTLEEANSDFVNWVKQRSRWYKGYIQTWLVHMRHPVGLWRELGPKPFLAFNLVVGATPLVALINPIFWLLTLLWFTGKPQFIPTLFPSWIYFPGLFCMVLGNFMVFYISVISIRVSGYPNLLGAVLLSPLYWAMMSIAAVKAFLQLVIAPWFWEKTTHGLDREIPAEVQVART
jgi:cellulose synthase/poly-beta-1,6-N-acetylglucosamine synthase-like glycosyltransferase